MLQHNPLGPAGYHGPVYYLEGATMPNVGMRAAVPPILGEPLPHGLLGSCVDVVTTADVHEMNGTDMLPMSCATAGQWQDCPDPADGWTNPTAKVFDRPDVCTFEPFTAYTGVECSVVGLSFEEGQARADDQLRRGEQLALEDWFMRRGLSWMADGNDLTPVSGPLHIAQGIGLLETWLAVNYGGRGLIHAPIGVSALLSMNRLVDFVGDDECPRTLAGNGVVLGGGYSANLGPATRPATGDPAPADAAWIYVTPPVRVRRDTPQRVVSERWQGINTSVNDQRALSETTFVTEVACCTAAAVLVSLSGCCTAAA